MHTPRFFRQAPDASIFTEDVLFLDHIGPRIGLISASVAGRKAYSQRIWLLRTHSRLIFSRCEVGTTCQMRSVTVDLTPVGVCCISSPRRAQRRWLSFAWSCAGVS